MTRQDPLTIRRMAVQAMPTPHWLFRLPIVRHLRWYARAKFILPHLSLFWSLGVQPKDAHFHLEHLEAIWRGEK